MDTNVIHGLCVSASVALIAIKHCCLRVLSTLRICVHCITPFYIAPPFSVMLTTCITYDDRARDSFAAMCLNFSVALAGRWQSSYHYWLCRVPLTALLSHYPCKLLTCYGYMMATKIFLAISVIAVLSYTGDYIFKLLSVYASCSSSIRYNIHFAFINIVLSL